MEPGRVPCHATLGTPTPTHRYSVLTRAVTVVIGLGLKCAMGSNQTLRNSQMYHIDILSELSAFWLDFKAHVARTKYVRRPQTT